MKRIIRFLLVTGLVFSVFLLAGVGNAWAKAPASTSPAYPYGKIDPTPAKPAITITGNQKKTIAGIATVAGINAVAEISAHPKPEKAFSKLIQISLTSGALDICFEAKAGWVIRHDQVVVATAQKNGRLCTRTFSGGGFYLAKK